jgi:hypothetical protein
VTLPSPRAVDGAVVLDLATRTATVMPTETGFPAMLWRHGMEKMGRGGYGAPTVWAHGLGHQQIAPVNLRAERSSSRSAAVIRPGKSWSARLPCPRSWCSIVTPKRSCPSSSAAGTRGRSRSGRGHVCINVAKPSVSEVRARQLGLWIEGRRGEYSFLSPVTRPAHPGPRPRAVGCFPGTALTLPADVPSRS